MATYRCSSRPNISKKSVLAMFQDGTGTKDWLLSLEDSQWSIMSFDVESRVVCIAVDTTYGNLTNIVSLTLPVITKSF